MKPIVEWVREPEGFGCFRKKERRAGAVADVNRGVCGWAEVGGGLGSWRLMAREGKIEGKGAGVVFWGFEEGGVGGGEWEGDQERGLRDLLGKGFLGWCGGWCVGLGY